MPLVNIYGARNMVKDPTWFKNDENPSTIDLIITNRANCILKRIVTGTGISDFHAMPVAIFRQHLDKPKAKEIQYRNYKNFDENIFRNDLYSRLQDYEGQWILINFIPYFSAY